jgi:methionyl-tRNA formyltransferase
VRVVFLASGAFAVPSLEALVAAGHEVAALVTQPDRVSGRGLALVPPKVKPVAERHGIRVLQLERIRKPEAQEALRELAPELQVVVAFGQILPRAVIDIAPRGTVNVHASLLPRLRGAAPIQWAIANGDTETGVTTMQIDEGLDTGPLLLSRSLAIAPEETAAELEPRLARLGGELLVETLAGLESGTLTAVPQNPALATLAPLLRKEDGRVDWTLPAHAIACRARGFYPWPGAYTQLDGRLLKLMRVRERPEPAGAAPGEVVETSAAGVSVACGQDTRLLLEQVQPESRKAMPAGAWAQGARLQRGRRLG